MNSYKSPWTIGKLLKTKEFWMLVLIFGFLFMGLVATMAQMIPRLGSLGVAPDLAILCLSIASIIGIPGSFAWAPSTRRSAPARPTAFSAPAGL